MSAEPTGVEEPIVEGEIIDDSTDPQDTGLAIELASSATLFRSDQPATVLERATTLANTLAPVIKARTLFTQIGPKKHVHVEGWTLLGGLLGVFPVITETRALDDSDDPIGFMARCEVRTRSGEVIGAAEAECRRTEKSGRWVASKADPYALRSMAQTRATSRALRGPLGFVMILAGYEALSAEEAQGSSDSWEQATPARTRQGRSQERQRSTVTQRETSKTSDPKPMSAGQKSKIEALAKDLGLGRAELHTIAGVRSIKPELITFDEAKRLIDTLDARLSVSGSGDASSVPSGSDVASDPDPSLGSPAERMKLLDELMVVFGSKNAIVKAAKTNVEKLSAARMRELLAEATKGGE